MLSGFSGVWAAAATVAELHDDKQVLDNGFLPEVLAADGSAFRVVAAPYHFDEQPTTPRRAAPAFGEHTEEILREAGLDAQRIAELKERGALG